MKKELQHTPNHQEYWNHIEKLRQSLESDMAKSGKRDIHKNTMDDLINALNVDKSFNESKSTKNIPDFYNIIKNSSKKTEYLQHLFTHHTSKLSFQFLIADMVEKDKKLDYRWKEDGINYFNTSFQHIYEIMTDSKPLIGLCDGCKMDYYGEDKKKCLLILNNFHNDKDGFISELFRD